MTPNHIIRGTIESISTWFKKAKPNSTHADFQVQLGVHFEEISEMCDALTGVDQRTKNMIAVVRDQAHLLAERLKTGGEELRVMVTPEDRVDFLDGLCDQIVTATGSGVFSGLLMTPAVEEVDRSNWSKYVDGEAIFDENGKITKGPDYFKPDLRKYT